MVEFENDIKNCIDVLEKGGTMLYPTDTIWGIGCDATNEEAIEKIYKVKQRPKEKSFIILLAEARDILHYVAAPPPDIIDIIKNFETPTTVIYNNALGFPDSALHEDGSIAIRVTNDTFCKALIKRFKKPIVSTSANLSGQPSAPFFNMIDEKIKEQVDYVVQYRQEDTISRPPSRLVRVHEDGTLDILRP
ncbi:MAG TPA: L-threonylcarbamoyladenylate synthase [Flavipsychrobacter sp.]|nr:L-threonylcarbamoyladenylate synthase [Flavipsychrobacter sp.]